MHSNIFDRLSFLSLFLVVVLLPIFCLPFTNIPIDVSKVLLLVLGLALSVIFWSIGRFSDGKVVFPKSWLLLSALAVSLVFLISSIWSRNSQVSLFGAMLDVGSFWFIFSGFVLMFMSSIIFRTSERAKMVLTGTILSAVFVLFFQVIHLFMPKVLSLGILAQKTSNILGSWNALGLFAGFSSLMFLLAIEFFPVSKKRKLLLEVFIALSLLLAAIVNFSLVWVLVGIFSLIIFVYKVSITSQSVESEENHKKVFPLVSFVVMIVSLLFFMSGQFVANVVVSKLQISDIEVSVPLKETMSVTKGVILKNPLFGIGPNRFGEAWSMYKPSWINATQFWDTTFVSGSGLLPTLLSTTGVLGIISWLVFLVLFVTAGVKYLFYNMKNGINWEMMTFFALSLYLFVASFFHSTGTVMFFLALAFSGVFLGLSSSSSKKEISMSFLNDHRKSFFSILGLIALVVFSVVISFKYVERFASLSYFSKAVYATSVPDAENYIVKALSLYNNDLYLRTYSQIALAKINSMVSGKETALTEEEKTTLKQSIDQAVASATMAADYSPSNFVNFQFLGSVYQSVGQFGVEGAYDKSIEAYNKALTLNPLNPGIKIGMASVAMSNKKYKEAKDYINEALSLKANYTDAFVLLSQISKIEGNNSEALSYAETALSLVPGDENLVKYVDSLKNPASSQSSNSSTEKSKQ